jgi:hypothetical protein
MARPHIDYLQSQTVPWQPSHWPHLPGCELKILSRDTDRGSASVLVRYPSGWAAPGPGFLGTGEEFLVLDGLLELDGRRCAQDTFGWFGAGYRHASRSAPDGAVVLAFYDAEPVWTHGEPPADRPAAEARVIDTFELPWAGGDGDAAFGGQGHLRKVLRDSPDAGAATMLIAAPPHLHPPRWRARQQIHGYAEEASRTDRTARAAAASRCGAGTARRSRARSRPTSSRSRAHRTTSRHCLPACRRQARIRGGRDATDGRRPPLHRRRRRAGAAAALSMSAGAASIQCCHHWAARGASRRGRSS